MKLLPRLLLFPVCIGSLCQTGHGQISYRPDGRIIAAQRSLPSTGPGSAWFNPAALSETRRAHVQAGIFTTESGNGTRTFWDLSATLPSSLAPLLPIGISAGFGWEGNESKIDNSNAVYVESVSRPGLALAYPTAGEGPLRVAAGLAFPNYHFNAFGAVKSSSTAMDMGALGTLDMRWAGRLRVGFTYFCLVNPEVELPDGRGIYNIPGGWVASFGYASPGETLRLLWEGYYAESNSSGEGPDFETSIGMNALEAEAKPFPWMGIKAEVTRVSNHSSLGTVFYPVLDPWPIRFYLEANIGHDNLDIPGLGWLLGPAEDEGRGYVVGLSLGGGI